MRLLRSVWPFVLLLASMPAAAGGDAERDAEIRACVARLSTADDADRAKAADRLVELGLPAVLQVARGGASLDDKAWTAFADACTTGKHGWFAVWLNAEAGSAPDAHKRRLVALAQRLDPEVGKKHSPEEIEKVVREYLIEGRGARCYTGYDTEIAKLGHDAVPVVLKMLREGDRREMLTSIGCSAVAILAVREDVPAIREAFLAGQTDLAHALDALQRRGVTEATDALLAAVAAGRLDDDVARALENSPDRARTVKAVRAWAAAAPPESLDDGARMAAARLFGEFGARDAAPLVESWIAKATKDYEFTGLADVLTTLGNREGLALSLRIASERRTRFPCMNPPTEADIADDVAKGLLPCNGFHPIDRWDAARRLGEIAAGAVKVPSHDEWMAAYRAAREAHREPANEADALDGIAAELTKWWAASKDKVTFDAASGRWSVGK